MTATATETIEVSIPLPRALDTRVYLHLTIREKSIMLFLTTSTPDELSTPASMGSFVYALPDRFNPNQPISTALFSQESNMEFATRIAKLLARKTQLPTYVGSSLNLSSMGMGGTPEEEMEAFKRVIEVVVAKTQHIARTPSA